MTRSRKRSPTFGIGEWYGKLYTELMPDERRTYADELVNVPRNQRPTHPCPFKPRPAPDVMPPCTKEGGVCSLRRYESLSGGAVPTGGQAGTLRATCPYRFHEADEVWRWVGETVLGTDAPLKVGEVGFLEGFTDAEDAEGDDVGRIDMILVNPSSLNLEQPVHTLAWCAVELQAVYFSGGSMSADFRAILHHQDDSTLPFPGGRRRPDYRSSGPKRLMPQLQIKVPTLRRWGKKMAVVVDRAFFNSIGAMDNVGDISNCDIVWFIVDWEVTPGRSAARLTRGDVRFTTLERAVEGLTGGKPVSLSTFEGRIRSKL